MKFTEADKKTELLYQAFIKEISKPYQDTLKNIEEQLIKLYSKYSVDGKLNMVIMSKRDKNRVTRLEKLLININDELTKLNRGRPQQLAGYLTNIYDTNYTGVTKALGEAVNVSFKLIDRQAVYESVLNPMAKIGLSDNADIVRRNIQRSITSSILQGHSIQDMSQGIQKALETNANNAVRIARTETGKVQNTARYDAYEEANKLGIEMDIVWQSAQDSRTRSYDKGDKADHVILNEERVKFGEPFSNGLLKPCDEMGSPQEVINCRCTTRVELLQYKGKTKFDV